MHREQHGWPRRMLTQGAHFVCTGSNMGWPAAVWAQPILEQVQPAESRANGIVSLNGSGFGTDKQALQVLFGSAPAKIVSTAACRSRSPGKRPRSVRSKLAKTASSAGPCPSSG